MTYFVPVGVIQDKFTEMCHKYLNGQSWPYHLSCLINSYLSIFIWLSQYGLAFWKVYLWASLKITCILVRQVIFLKKSGGVISKIYFLISWSLICTPLILLSASVKMTGTSATLIITVWEWTPLANSWYKGKRFR